MTKQPLRGEDARKPTISARIAAAIPTLTPVHRRMAEYVQANPYRAATMRIDELAGAVGASVASANRFARTLGFDGYPSFREALVRGFEATLAHVERLRNAQETPAASGDVFDRTLDQTIVNLHATRGTIDAASADAAVSAIMKAERVYVLGLGTSAFLAGLMEYNLAPYHEGVESLAQVGGVTHAARHLSRATGSDLLVAIAFPRYINDTIVLATRAANIGVPVLALTDSAESPVARIADLPLIVRSERNFGSNCDAAVLAVIEALVDSVAHRSKRSVRAAADVTESVHSWLASPQRNEQARAAVAPEKRRRQRARDERTGRKGRNGADKS